MQMNDHYNITKSTSYFKEFGKINCFIYILKSGIELVVESLKLCLQCTAENTSVDLNRSLKLKKEVVAINVILMQILHYFLENINITLYV